MPVDPFALGVGKRDDLFFRVTGRHVIEAAPEGDSVAIAVSALPATGTALVLQVDPELRVAGAWRATGGSVTFTPEGNVLPVSSDGTHVEPLDAAEPVASAARIIARAVLPWLNPDLPTRFASGDSVGDRSVRTLGGHRMLFIRDAGSDGIDEVALNVDSAGGAALLEHVVVDGGKQSAHRAMVWFGPR